MTTLLSYCATDGHVHVFGDRQTYPMTPNRHYTPGQADVPALRTHLLNCNIDRVVLIQPSVYGTDNRCMLDAVKRLGNATRGVAVVDSDASYSVLERLVEQNVRGLRLNLESSGQHASEQIQRNVCAWLAAMRALGMHLQIYAAFSTIIHSLTWLDTLKTPVVLDHFAMIPLSKSDKELDIRALCDRIAEGNYYIKLSAPYRISNDDQDQGHIIELAHRLIQSNPNRMLWASDWPHTNRVPNIHPLEVSPFRKVSSKSICAQWEAWGIDSQRCSAYCV
ncbi:amidohydrolase family protein [Alcaligenes sp. 13f]|uniref:amidohydrolase family protein n=1 Tax=Alcaligenes sp. 13f TaxID=2841924 RepID=UPI001CF6C331|nr:amidohydrolase family protein [Alcaligenes sp. 13f]MCB4321983.1 amidohydrolase family protein [Alcaligenes sp. 13f]